MTNTTSPATIEIGSYVSGGQPGTDDFDFGIVADIQDGIATVGWEQGMSTEHPVGDLTLLTHGEYLALRERMFTRSDRSDEDTD